MWLRYPTDFLIQMFSVLLNENKYLAVTWNGYTVMTIDKNNQDEILTEVYSNTSSLMYRNLETRMIAAYYDSHGILWIGTDGGGVIWFIIVFIRTGIMRFVLL